MLLTPRYDGPSLLRIDVPIGDPGALVVRQRRRLASILGGLDEAQWATASRCESWSVKDVVAHLVSTNEFWAGSIRSALDGEPTRVLATFDPVATPAALVDAFRHQGPAEVLDAFVETGRALAATVAGLDGEAWKLPGEAPLGHVPLYAVALHALWDSWIHERDILLPLGLTPVEEPDEIGACLLYSAALSPALVATSGSIRTGAVAAEAIAPDVRFTVEVGPSVVVHDGAVPPGALHLVGPAVDLVEGLSTRGPLPCPVPDADRWLLGGLAEGFDQAT